MSDSESPTLISRHVVDAWLEPLVDGPCGGNLEYDPEFLEMELSAAGKPETQFAPAEPPSWPQVRDQAASLLGRTRDLRVGMLWLRASVSLEGMPAMAEGLRLLTGWVDRYWPDVHPALDPDDGDASARLSALGALVESPGLLGDLRLARLAHDRRLGGMRVRDVELALGRLPPRPDESAPLLGEISNALADMPEIAALLRQACSESLQHIDQLQKLVNQYAPSDRLIVLKPLREVVLALQEVASAEQGAAAGDGTAAAAEAADAGDAPAAAEGAARRRGSAGGIETRQDAVRAIELVCAYLERSEPSNPAQLMLRRAQRLIDKNFLELVKELAPDAIRDVARVMGVDPDTIGDNPYR